MVQPENDDADEPDAWDGMSSKLLYLADNLATFRKLVASDLDSDLVRLSDQQKSDVLFKMSRGNKSGMRDDSADVETLRVKTKALEKKVEEGINLAQEHHLLACHWEEACLNQQRRSEDLERRLEKTEEELEMYKEKVSKLEKDRDCHNERLCCYLKRSADALSSEMFFTHWRKQAGLGYVDEKRRPKVIEEVRTNLNSSLAENTRLVSRFKDLAERRLVVAQNWINPAGSESFLGLVFRAWQNARFWIKEDRNNWMNAVSLRWHIKQNAWAEKLVEKLEDDTINAMADASATQFALEMERQRFRESLEMSQEDMEEFRHMRLLAKEKFKAELIAREKRLREISDGEITTLRQEREDLMEQVDDLQDTLYTDNENGTGHANQFPVCRRSEGTRCIDCSRRIVFQQPDGANKIQTFVGIKGKSRDVAIDDFVRNIVGPYQASLFTRGKPPRRR